MAKLTPDDYEFFERVHDNISSSNALPFEIPEERLAKIVIKSAKFFWEYKDDATYEKSLYIPYSSFANKDVNSNAELQLPNGIEGILQVFTTGNYAGITINDAIRIPLLDSYGSTYKTFSTSNSQQSGYTGDHYQPSDSIIALMEYDMMNNTFKKGVQFSFNRHKSILNVLGNSYGMSLVLQCFVRVDIKYLYNDYMFEEYVTARTMEELGKITSSFEFNYPGGVRLNYDQIRSDGQEKRREIEEELKGSQSVPYIFVR